MKRLAIPLGVVTCLAGSLALMSTQANAQGVGDLYWGINGGAQFYNENDINGNDIEFDPGWAASAQVGYIFGSVRTEGEVECNEADVKNYSSGSIDLSAWRYTGSILFDFIGFSRSNILPYMGVGFGFADMEFSGDLEDDDLAFTAHADVGVSLASARNFDVVVGCRYEWYETDLGGIDDAITAHQLRLGLRFFGGPGGCC